MQNTERKPEWKAPRLVVQGHVCEIVAVSGKGVGKEIYGPDKDSLKGGGSE